MAASIFDVLPTVEEQADFLIGALAILAERQRAAAADPVPRGASVARSNFGRRPVTAERASELALDAGPARPTVHCTSAA